MRWLSILLTFALAFAPSAAFAAIAFDNSTSATQTANFSFTVGSGTNRLLVCQSTGSVSASDSVTAISYNSVALTKLDGKQTTGDRFVSVWYLLGPSSGSNTVTVTGSDFRIQCASYSGVKQTGFPDSSTGLTLVSSNTSPYSLSTTVVASNSWLIGVAYGASSDQLTASTNTTVRSGAGTGAGVYDSNGTVGTGSQSLTYTFSPSQTTNVITFSIAPAAATNPFQLWTNLPL